MSVNTGIEWTDSTWNPTRGCTRVSEGCRHCYAEKIAARFSDPGQPYHGLAIRSPDGGRWTGKVELVESALDLPLRWRYPRRIFVNSMSDLFHESVPDEWVDRIFVVMARAPQHGFQVLTKRPTRMRAYIVAARGRFDDEAPWPLPNVWLGTSVEDQATADERIPDLLGTPAAVRFVSYEPALGPVDFRMLHHDGITNIDVLAGTHGVGVPTHYGPRLDWIIVGGESGPGARPFRIEWGQAVVDQCRAAGVACFVKQLGAHVIQDGEHRRKRDRKGGDWSEWPHTLRVREFPR